MNITLAKTYISHNGVFTATIWSIEVWSDGETTDVLVKYVRTNKNTGNKTRGQLTAREFASLYHEVM